MPYNGKFYGTTISGGTYGVGTVFQLTPPAHAGGAWKHQVIYNLNHAVDNVAFDEPVSSSLAFDANGVLYTATSNIIFQLSPPATPTGAWKRTVIYKFNSVVYPAVIASSNGALYGTIGQEGPSSVEIFQLTPPSAPGGSWTESTLYTFNGVSGVFPFPSFFLDSSGIIYGTTPVGGSLGNGMVFTLTPPSAPGGAWAESVLYNFTGGSDGGYPFGLTFGPDGALYGGTYRGGSTNSCQSGFIGCGTLFELAPPAEAGGSWTESVLYAFSGGSDGGMPNSVTQAADGTIYGSGGISGCGMLFQLAPSDGGWNESTLHTFASAGSDGCAPTSVLLDDSGDLLVSTRQSPYEFTPPSVSGGAWSESLVYNFALDSDGSQPTANLAFDSTGAIYGTTTAGGLSDGGTVFKLSPPSKHGHPWTETLLYSFMGSADGAGSALGLVMDAAGNLYGETSTGGEIGGGTVFEISPPSAAAGSWTYTLLYSFGGSGDGFNPVGALLLDAGTLYGVTSSGGASNAGTMFSLTPPATPGGPATYALLYSFSDGAQYPDSGLAMNANGALYGTSNSPKTGTVFQLTPPVSVGANWTETVLHVFKGDEDGKRPSGGVLALDARGVLYGTTRLGGGTCRGINGPGCGTVYQVAPPAIAGESWREKVLFSFSTDHGDGGTEPSNVVFRDGVLVGVTGSTNGKTEPLFQLAPPAAPGSAWQESVLEDLNFMESFAESVALSGAHLYGASEYGGYAQAGSIFEAQ